MKLKTISKIVLLVVSFSAYHQCAAKVLIIVPVYNRPDFIEIQYKTFNKFLKDDYEYTVFNDANDPAMQQTIEQTCAQFNIRCIRVPQEVHNVDPNCHRSVAGYRHGEVMQFAFEHYGFDHDDIVVLMDSDVFLIRELSVRDYLGECDLFGTFQNALVPQCCFFNMPKLNNPRELNFRASIASCGGFLDAGTLTSKYIANHGVKCRNLDVTWTVTERNFVNKHADISSQLAAKGYSVAEIKLIKTIIDISVEAQKANSLTAARVSFDYDIGFYETSLFLDYKHGSGWHGPNAANVKVKDQLIKDFIETILNA